VVVDETYPPVKLVAYGIGASIIVYLCKVMQRLVILSIQRLAVECVYLPEGRKGVQELVAILLCEGKNLSSNIFYPHSVAVVARRGEGGG